MSDEPTLASGLPEYLADLHAANQALRDQRAALWDEVAEYRNAINWGTTCLNCASLLEQNYRDYVRAEQAEAEAEELRQEITEMDRRAANS